METVMDRPAPGGWMTRKAPGVVTPPAERLAKVVERHVSRLGREREHRLATVAAAVARELVLAEPVLGHLVGVEDIAERLAPLVAAAAGRLGRELKDEGGRPAGTATGGQTACTAPSFSEQPPSGRSRATAQAASDESPDGGHPKASEPGQPVATAQAAGLVAPAPTPPKNAGDQTASIGAQPTKSGASPAVRPAPKRSPRTPAGIARSAELLMDSYKLRDGRPIGDVRWGELASLAARSLEEACVLEAIRTRGTPADPGVKVRAILKDADLAEIVARAKERAR